MTDTLRLVENIPANANTTFGGEASCQQKAERPGLLVQSISHCIVIWLFIVIHCGQLLQ